MTMQKPCQVSPSQRVQQQYVRPDSPPPSAVKKSPLAMLVETCSSIGQELTTSSMPSTSKSADIPTQYESRKNRLATSPSSDHSKAHSPLYSSQHRASFSSKQPTSVVGQSHTRSQPSQLTAAALASQYQLMYQQLLYQAELEHLQRAKDTLAATPSITKGTLQEPRQLPSSKSKSPCGICSLSASYTGGPCIHDNVGGNSSLNQMLAMLNPGSSAAAVLAYSNRLAGINQAYLENPTVPLGAASYTTPAAKKWDSSSLTSAHTLDSRRSSANSNSSVISPRHTETLDQPMDLQIQKSKSPISSIRLIECHWVGAEGYCGKRFHSQDDLMKHLKLHVVSCPRVVVSSDEENQINNNSRKRGASASPPSSNKMMKPTPSVLSNMSALINKHHRERFQPYSIPANLLLAPQ